MPRSPVRSETPLVATGYVDFRQFDELAAELESSVPGFSACGLKVSEIRTMRVAVGRSGLIEGQVLGLPPRRQLLDCPMIPQLIAAAEAAGWTIEDGEGPSIRFRRADAQPLGPKPFEFTSPHEESLYFRGEAGTAERRVSVTISTDPRDELVFRIEAPSDSIDAATAWCERVLEKQRTLNLKWLGVCRRPDPQTLVIVPNELDPDSAAQAFASVRSEFFETFNIHGDSMLPNLRDGDVAFVDKTRSGVPPRGTIVVFATEQGNFIKRVIGLPGERLEFGQDEVLINGKPLSASPTGGSDAAAQCGFQLREQRFQDGTNFQFFDARVAKSATVEIPAGHVFVLGDNRAVSKDSRDLGPIPVERILGRAGFIAWSKPGDAIDWERTTSPIK